MWQQPPVRPHWGALSERGVQWFLVLRAEDRVRNQSMFLHDIGWCMDDLFVMEPTVAQSSGEAVDWELFEYLSIFCLCWFTPVCGITEGKIPALPLPKIYPDGFIASPVSVMQNGCTRFRHTEYVTMEIRQQNVDLKKTQSIFWCSPLKHIQYLQCQHRTLHTQNTTAGHEFGN